MAILNYTTTVAVERTVAVVNKLLTEAGARQILTEYDADCEIIGVAFAVDTTYGRQTFSLPVHADKTLKAMSADPAVPRRFCDHDQARRVAWRIVKDWLEAQLAIIRTEMVTLDQVMLPYMRADSDGRTVYDLWASQKALGAGG